MELKKELTKIQTYATRAANEKVVVAEQEFQLVLKNVATELGIDFQSENWGISKDMRYLEKMETVKTKEEKK